MIVSIVLLCTGFGVYSFFRLNEVESQKDFNLYTLVPQSAIAVLKQTVWQNWWMTSTS